MIVPIKLKLSIGNNNYNNYNNIFNSWHTQMLLYTYNNKRLICILYGDLPQPHPLILLVLIVSYHGEDEKQMNLMSSREI